jgi:antitoxin MazE
MKTNIQKWGNSLGIRLPQALAHKKSLTVGSTVVLTETDTGVLVEVAPIQKPSLQTLVKKITQSNQHTEVDFGPAVGNEVW